MIESNSRKLANGELDVGEFFIRVSLFNDGFLEDLDEFAAGDEPTSDVNNEMNEEAPEFDDNKRHASNNDASCVICIDRTRELVFFPCRHVIVCEPCWAEVIADETNSKCPVCKEIVKETTAIYMA